MKMIEHIWADRRETETSVIAIATRTKTNITRKHCELDTNQNKNKYVIWTCGKYEQQRRQWSKFYTTGWEINASFLDQSKDELKLNHSSPWKLWTPHWKLPLKEWLTVPMKG